MEFVKEYAAGSEFPAELSYSCFFQTENAFYAVTAQKKQLYCCSKNNTTVISLFREYNKIVSNSMGTDFFAYTQIPNKNEIAVFHLDHHFKELDCLKIKKIEGNYQAVNLWFDEGQNFLYLVYPKAILKYNCNGDYLGNFMSAPLETFYSSVCTFKNYLFLAYIRNNCSHVGLYHLDGAFREQVSLGGGYQFLGMQVIPDKKSEILRLHVIKKGEIPLFFELKFQESHNPTTEFCKTVPAGPDDRISKEGIEVEIILSDGIGEATCQIKL